MAKHGTRKRKTAKKSTEACRGTVSPRFDPAHHNRVGVKIINDRGIESLEIVEIAK